MDRLPIVLISLLLGSALAGGAAADDRRGSPAGFAQLILLFISDASRDLLSKRAASEGRDPISASEAKPEQDAPGSREGRRQEAYKRLEDREHEARRARDDYRREAWNGLAERRFLGAANIDAYERLRAAEQRMNVREWQAQQARDEYQREARKAREVRLRQAGNAATGG